MKRANLNIQVTDLTIRKEYQCKRDDFIWNTKYSMENPYTGNDICKIIEMIIHDVKPDTYNSFICDSPSYGYLGKVFPYEIAYTISPSNKKLCKSIIKILDPVDFIMNHLHGVSCLHEEYLEFLDYLLKKYLSEYKDIIKFNDRVPSEIRNFVMEVYEINKLSISTLNEFESVPRVIYQLTIENINGETLLKLFHDEYLCMPIIFSLIVLFQGIYVLSRLNMAGLLHLDIKTNNIMIELTNKNIKIGSYNIVPLIVPIYKKKLNSYRNAKFKLIDLDNVEIKKKYIFPYDYYRFSKIMVHHFAKMKITNTKHKNIISQVIDSINITNSSLNKGQKIIGEEGIVERSKNLIIDPLNYLLIDKLLHNLSSIINNMGAIIK